MASIDFFRDEKRTTRGEAAGFGVSCAALEVIRMRCDAQGVSLEVAGTEEDTLNA